MRGWGLMCWNRTQPGCPWVLLWVSPAPRPGCPEPPLVDERSFAIWLWANFSPLGSQFPLLQKGGSDLLSPAPPSPQPLLGAAGARSHGLARHKDPEARAGPAGGGGRAGSPALSPSHGIGAPGPSPGPGAPLVTQASWKRRGRATRIPRHPTQSSRSDRLHVPSPPHRYLRWASPAVCSAPAPSGRPFLLLPLLPSGHRLVVLGQAPPPPLPGPGPAKPNISSPFISPWAQLLSLLLAFTSLWLAAQWPICWELPCGD